MESVFFSDFSRLRQSTPCTGCSSAIITAGNDADLTTRRDKLQFIQDPPEQIGMRVTVRKGDPNPPHADADLGADLE